MELKNMIDIQMDSCKEGKDNSGVYRMYNNSREEAIKHLKELLIEGTKIHKEIEGKSVIESKDKGFRAIKIEGKIDWIKAFWNISDGELN